MKLTSMFKRLLGSCLVNYPSLNFQSNVIPFPGISVPWLLLSVWDCSSFPLAHHSTEKRSMPEFTSILEMSLLSPCCTANSLSLDDEDNQPFVCMLVLIRAGSK